MSWSTRPCSGTPTRPRRCRCSSRSRPIRSVSWRGSPSTSERSSPACTRSSGTSSGGVRPLEFALVLFGLAFLRGFAEGVAFGNASVGVAGLLAWCWVIGRGRPQVGRAGRPRGDDQARSGRGRLLGDAIDLPPRGARGPRRGWCALRAHVAAGRHPVVVRLCEGPVLLGPGVRGGAAHLGRLQPPAVRRARYGKARRDRTRARGWWRWPCSSAGRSSPSPWWSSRGFRR